MKLYIKYFKKYWKTLLMVVFFIALQVSTLLTLPKYMAKMINIGVQQKGIETFIYPEISKQSFDLILTLSTNKEKQIFNNAYEQKQEKYVLKEATKDLETVTINKNNIIATLIQKNEMVKVFEIAQMNDEQKQVLFHSFQTDKEDILTKFVQSNMIYNELNQLGYKDTSIDYIIKEGIMMLLIAVSGMFFVICASYFTSKFAANVSKDLRLMLFQKIQTFSEKEYDKFSTSSLITRTINDTSQIQNLVGMCLRMGLMSPLIAIGAFIQSSNTNVNLMWTIVVGIIAFIVLMVIIFASVLPRFAKARKLMDKINQVLRENLSGLRVIRAFNTQKRQTKQFNEVNDEIFKNNMAISKTITLANPGLLLITNAVTVLIVYFGAGLVGNQTLQIGDLLSFIQFATQIMFGFMLFGFLFFMLPQISIALKRIDEVMKVENKIHETKQTPQFESNGMIEFKNVTFRYDDTSLPAIENISFKAEVGKTVAFIGGTGSGKSTIGKLINRFYDATGEILINGINIKDYTLKDLRNEIAYVPQIGQVFSTTIKENIAYGEAKIDEKRVQEVANIACAEKFILEKENTYDHVLNQRGTNLSGGQKQRLQIARALYKNSKILFLDDCLSALDYKTDATVRKNLKNLAEPKTIIIVAQRIPTIMHADEIIVLDEGKIVGRGKHDDLIKTCKVYQDIAASQIQQEEV